MWDLVKAASIRRLAPLDKRVMYSTLTGKAY